MSISLSNVTKYFGKVKAVSSLNLEIGDGECFSMLGPSGCGKTTTLRMVAGFEDLDEGEISVNGKLLSSSGKKYYLPPEKRDFGMVFQAFAVWPHMSVYENVAFPLRVKKVGAAELHKRTTEALQHTNLLDVAQKSPADLSGGGKQRVALARALAINPSVMLLDEPLSSLDPHLREEMRFEIKELQKNLGVTILYVTHDQEIALAISDRMALLDEQGSIRQVGTPEELFSSPSDEFVFSFLGMSNFLRVNVAGGLASLDDCVFPLAPQAGLAGEVRVGFRPSDVHLSRQGEGLRATVRRASFLGAFTDYQLDVCGQHVRTAVDTHEALAHDLLLAEGDACVINLRNAHWFS